MLRPKELSHTGRRNGLNYYVDIFTTVAKVNIHFSLGTN